MIHTRAKTLFKFLLTFLTLSTISSVPVLSPPDFSPFLDEYVLDSSVVEGSVGAPSDIINIVRKYRNLIQFYLPIYATNNEECQIAVRNFLPSIAKEKIDSWALRMADSWGKIPDGLFFGNIHAVGMYEECLETKGTVIPYRNETTEISEINFQGKYCKVYYGPIEESNNLKSGLIVAIKTPLPFYYGTCMPSVCSKEDLMESLSQTLNKYSKEVLLLDCHEEGVPNHTTSFDGFDGFVCGLLGLLIVLALIGTIIQENNLERFGKTRAGKLILKKLTCFSITKSFKTTFEYRKKRENAITCLDGIRVITLIWIITCHQYETGLKFLVNTVDSSKYQDPYIGQLITDGYQSVDTFFVLSGILLSYRLFPVILEGKNLSAKYFLRGFAVSFFRRVVRLLPSIFVVATFSSTILRFLGFGPRSSALDEFSEHCRDNWWKDPLFVNNLIHDEEVIITQADCLTHCWYTAVEMQLFLIVPLVFLPRIYDKLSGFLWLSFLTLMSQVIPLIILLIYEFPPVLFPSVTIQENFDFYSKYYEVPWCRSAPWFIGIWTGIILVKYPHIIRKITKLQVVIGYIIALALGILLVVGLYRYNHVGEHSEIPNWLSGFYGFFSRPVWAICVSWVVLTCYTKNAWYVNAGLSWWGWQPLSRLTFAMYLIHPVVQIWWASTLYVPVYYSYLGKLFEITGVFFISFIFAFLLSTLVEKPFLRLTENIASSRAIGINSSRQNSRKTQTEK
ncbi:UNVERIFIED_CONTAM: hypothetical protein RMT77_002207 [Armadillidium vulgare]